MYLLIAFVFAFVVFCAVAFCVIGSLHRISVHLDRIANILERRLT